MSGDIEGVPAPQAPVFRVARGAEAWAWADWAYAGADRTFGNRYDDPEGEYRVLYASSSRFGALVESLARFRPAPVSSELQTIDRGADPEPLAAGVLPGEWLVRRTIGSARLRGAYASVGHSRSLAVLGNELGGLALRLGIDELDAAAIRMRAPRKLTQAISRLVFERRDEGGRRRFSGVHYRSRLGDELDNWAAFEPSGEEESPIASLGSKPISERDPDLVRALEHLGLRLG